VLHVLVHYDVYVLTTGNVNAHIALLDNPG